MYCRLDYIFYQHAALPVSIQCIYDYIKPLSAPFKVRNTLLSWLNTVSALRQKVLLKFK